MKSSFERKNAILKSATSVFARKGFAESRIAEISKGAGIGPSGLYIHFKNKEDILFSIIENFLLESHSGLKEHLEGIEGAENKIRKAIWYHCKRYSQNKDTITIVLEARSYPRFYSSSAYTVLKEYTATIHDIIREGMDDGVFQGLSSPRILRDMILGTVDHIAINWCYQDQPNKPGQAAIIYKMAMDAVTPFSGGKNRLHKKARTRKHILHTASSLFAEKGLDTSMLEIARNADLGEGTVYEYFGNKEKLLADIPAEKLGRLYEDISDNSLDRLIHEKILKLFKFFRDDKSYTTILVLMLRTNRQFYKSRTSRIMEDVFQVIRDIIVRGQEEGVFKEDLDLEICQHLLFGTIDHIIIPWIIFNRDYDLMQIGEEVADLFVNALQNEQSSEI